MREERPREGGAGSVVELGESMGKVSEESRPEWRQSEPRLQDVAAESQQATLQSCEEGHGAQLHQTPP